MHNRIPPGPPYLGAAYYPEDWPLEQLDQDIALMREAGMNVMRVGEFAWSRMEPEEGQYDFDWLHLVVDKLGEAGIATILGTPTCTPPVWLTGRHPEVLFIREDGTPCTHGMRRHYCPNNPLYRDYCRRIVTRMAREFGRDERVIGWQIDNELYSAGFPFMSCSCPVCQVKFHAFLQQRYGSIGKLNQAWCTNLWSQTYQSFEQIPFPRPGVWSHPSLLLAWREFANQSYIEFSDMQADILHQLTRHPVGTDMMMVVGLDHYAINRKLDVVQYNHYHYHENVWQSAFWFDYVRPIKERPFWNTETATCWSGSVVTSGYSEPGFCRANSWMPFAMGGEANLYWLWRSHYAGHELMHGSVIQSTGRPMHTFGEVQEVSRGLAASAEFLNGTRPTPSGFAVHFSNFASLMFHDQPLVHGFNYQNAFLERIYRPILRAHYRPDVISPSVDLDDYGLVFSPFIPALDESGLRERIRPWIEAGGTWVVGPLSDIRTQDGAKFTHAPYGSLEEWAGIYCKYQLPGHPRDFALQWENGPRSKGGLWYDGLELRGAKPLAIYTEGPLEGLAAATIHKMGKGRIIVLATLPPPEDLLRLLNNLACDAGISPAADASANLLAVPRQGPAGHGLIAVEYENQPAWLNLRAEATDFLTGKRHSGRIEIPPYGVMILSIP